MPHYTTPTPEDAVAAAVTFSKEEPKTLGAAFARVDVGLDLKANDMKNTILAALRREGASGTVLVETNPVVKVAEGGYKVREGGRLLVEVVW